MNTTIMPKSLREAIVLGAAAFVPAVLTVAFHPGLADRRRAGLEIDEVRLEEVRDWRTNVTWIDARSAEEYERDHIPGALHFDLSRFDRDLGAILAAWKPGTSVVVYCGSEACATSREVAAQLRSAGLVDVFFLRGGWNSWLAAKR